jgi:hypothetical protein
MKKLGYSALAAAFSVSGCATKDVSVGTEGTAYNLNRCFGERTQCERRVATELVDESPASECNAPPDGDLKLEFERNFEPELCEDPFSCQFIFDRMAHAPDGSLWVLGHMQVFEPERDTLVLAHLAADGSTIALEHIEYPHTKFGAPSVLTNFTVDERGHCYVAACSNFTLSQGEVFADAAWLQEYDQMAQPVGARIEFSSGPAPQLRPGSGARIVYSASAANGAPHGTLTLFDAAGGLVWNQNNIAIGGIGVSGLVIDAQERITVLTQRDYDGSDATGSWGITRFDAHGNPTWDRTFAKRFEGWMPATLIADSIGNLTVAAVLPTMSQPSSDRFVAYIQNFSADGELRWVGQYRGVIGWPVLAADATTARVFVLDYSDDVLADRAGAIREISSDGSSCRRHRFELPSWDWDPAARHDMPHALVMGKNNDLYVLTQHTLARFSGVKPE